MTNLTAQQMADRDAALRSAADNVQVAQQEFNEAVQRVDELLGQLGKSKEVVEAAKVRAAAKRRLEDTEQAALAVLRGGVGRVWPKHEYMYLDGASGGGRRSLVSVYIGEGGVGGGGAGCTAS